MEIFCDIVSLEKKIFSGLVQAISMRGSLGDLSVSFGHAPLLTEIKPGPVTLSMKTGKEEVLYISGGYLEVQPKAVRVLADTVKRLEELDGQALQKVIKNSRKLLTEKKTDFDYGATLSGLVESMAQLRALKHKSRNR